MIKTFIIFEVVNIDGILQYCFICIAYGCYGTYSSNVFRNSTGIGRVCMYARVYVYVYVCVYACMYV